jgi:hypothetical protein
MRAGHSPENERADMLPLFPLHDICPRRDEALNIYAENSQGEKPCTTPVSRGQESSYIH